MVVRTACQPVCDVTLHEVGAVNPVPGAYTVSVSGARRSASA